MLTLVPRVVVDAAMHLEMDESMIRNPGFFMSLLSTLRYFPLSDLEVSDPFSPFHPLPTVEACGDPLSVCGSRSWGWARCAGACAVL
jgi:hypothetical protein